MTDPQLSVDAHVVDLARGWIGTPYYPQTRLKGIVTGEDRMIHAVERNAACDVTLDTFLIRWTAGVF